MNPFVRAPQWSRPASLEISELPLEGVPDLSWLPTFADFGTGVATSSTAFNRPAEYQAFAEVPPGVLAPLLSWAPVFADFGTGVATATSSTAFNRPAEYQAFAEVPPGVLAPLLSWAPVFADFGTGVATATSSTAFNRPAEYQAFAFPVQFVIPFIGDRAVVIHTPDEIPIGAETRFSVEYDVGGVPVPFDVPPSLRIYHLNLLTGAQITDLPLGPMTQYGASPAYFRAWTPAAKGVYILEVIGVYIGNVVLAVLPVTVRPKFDPIGLANDDVLVARNGDVPT